MQMRMSMTTVNVQTKKILKHLKNGRRKCKYTHGYTVCVCVRGEGERQRPSGSCGVCVRACVRARARARACSHACVRVCVRACLCVYVCGVDLNEHGDPTVDTHPADALGSYNCV